MEFKQDRFRTLKGPLRVIEKILSVAIPLTGIFFILDIPIYFGVSFFKQQYLGLFLGMVMALMFLIRPASPHGSREKVPFFDLICALLSLAIGFYVFIHYPILIATIGVISTFRVVVGIIILILILESVRRLAGWILVSIVLFFLLYNRFGYLLPGLLSTSQVSSGRIITQIFLGAGSIYGVALHVAAVVVFPFVLFAQVLFGTGGAEFLFRVSEALMGRFRGGPAKISIMVSSLFGTLSGSAVANVASTGLITIPLMKKTGYNSAYACAIEAVASTGGVIAPPIMGAAAFIIAELLGIPYAEVVKVALVPAVLYYLCLFIQVDLRASKEGLKGLPAEQIPPLIRVLLNGWLYIIPFAVLVYLIFFRYMRPEVSALYALLSLLVISLFKKETRLKLRPTMNFFEGASRGMFEIAIIGAAAGVIIGVMTYSGIGLTFSRILTEIAGSNLLFLAVLTAIASLVLGMGMPVTAAYLLLALLVAPALIRLDVNPLIAHLFIFYFGAFSFITPPVSLATYVAASIGEADFMKTTLQSLKLAFAGLVVPFILLFNPAIGLMGTTGEIVLEVFCAVVAVSAISIAMEGYFHRKISIIFRIILVMLSIMLFLPLHWMFSMMALAALAVITIFNYLPKKSFKQEVSNKTN
ncbi:MAG: TRAP transporter fused permease subunit [Bacillota bacterium]|nr:TRAP transporter fused permease subunit [Bacillota bacterium]